MGVNQKYLLYISYLGSHFKGSQVQTFLERRATVQGAIEESIDKLCGSKNEREYPMYFSSRTDAGVHAIKAGAHINLPPIKGKFLAPNILQEFLNHRFVKIKLPIRILEVKKVPQTFSAISSSTGKEYMYRIGILKNEFSDLRNNVSPITEADRTFFPSLKIDIEKVIETSKIFLGEHNFINFQGSPSGYPGPTVCIIRSFDFKKGFPFMPDNDFASSYYDYYHMTIEGNRFLYQMIRRMVGILLWVGANKISDKVVKDLLENPYSAKWNSGTFIAPPYGLYLLNNFYNPNHLIDEENKETSNSLEANFQ